VPRDDALARIRGTKAEMNLGSAGLTACATVQQDRSCAVVVIGGGEVRFPIAVQIRGGHTEWLEAGLRYPAAR